MITDKNVELLEDSAVQITITIDNKAIQTEYDDLVKKYCRTVSIKGFRKGKVPNDVLIRKFGDSLTAETAEQIIRKSLDEVLESIEQKPISTSQPEIDAEKDLELGQNFTFKVKYDTFPEVELGRHKGLSYKDLKVSIVKGDLDRELETLQEQNALVVDKNSGVVAQGDIASVDYVELDSEGREMDDTRRESFVFEVGTGYNLYKIDEDLIGMKKNDERILKKIYPEDFEIKELAGRELNLKVKLTNVKEKQLPEIDDELAQDISDKYETLDDLKAGIKKRLHEFAARKVREHNISQILDNIVEQSKVSLPKSMVEQELNRQWREFVARFRADEAAALRQIEIEGKSKEEILNSWRESAERRLKLQLVVGKLIEKEGIENSGKEVEQRLQTEADGRKMSLEQIKEEYGRNNYLDYLKVDMRNEKLYDFLLENSASSSSKKVKFLDLVQ